MYQFSPAFIGKTLVISIIQSALTMLYQGQCCNFEVLIRNCTSPIACNLTFEGLEHLMGVYRQVLAAVFRILIEQVPVEGCYAAGYVSGKPA